MSRTYYKIYKIEISLNRKPKMFIQIISIEAFKKYFKPNRLENNMAYTYAVLYLYLYNL